MVATDKSYGFWCLSCIDLLQVVTKLLASCMYYLTSCCTNEVQEIRLRYGDGRTADLGL